MTWKRVLLLSAVLSTASVAGEEHEIERPLVTVFGTADLKVVPDAVDVSVGIEIRGKDLSATIGEQTRRVTDTIGLIRKAGVDPKDIQTDFTNITPVYSDSKNGRTLDYFIVRKGIAFTLRDTNKFDTLLAMLIQSGVNRVPNVRFRVTEIGKYRDQAREMAVSAAREKAVALAAKLDQKIGKTFSIEEDQPAVGPFGAAWPYLGVMWPYPGVLANRTAEAAGTGTESPDSSLMVGQISVQAHVKVRFELQ